MWRGGVPAGARRRPRDEYAMLGNIEFDCVGPDHLEDYEVPDKPLL